MIVKMLPVLEDNYIFILIDEANKEAAVIDPATAQPVLNYLNENNLTLTKIYNTHHHYDHVGANKDLVTLFPSIEVYAGINDAGRIPCQTHYLKHGDTINFANETAHVYFVPGHTLGHICYYFPLKNGEHHLFIGDTIFSGGCGKLFEGTMEQMFASIKFLRNNLPENTTIWCTHEYTVENYLVLEKLEPNNKAIKDKLQNSIQVRKLNKYTVPFTLGEEMKTNSFLRFDDQKLKELTY